MRRPIALTALLLCLLLPLLPQRAEAPPPGFFTVKQDRGTWWLVDGQGQRFFSTGVNEISAGGDSKTMDPAEPEYFGLRFFESHDAWWRSTSRRLREWGFNTVGGWSDERVAAADDRPYVVSLQLGKMVGAPWSHVGSPASLATIRPLIERLTKYKDDALLIGYFIDNELDWYDDVVFTYWAAIDSADPGKARLWEMLDEAYRGDLGAFLADFAVTPAPSSFDALKRTLETIDIRPGRRPLVVSTFVEWLAGEYYRVLTGEIRRVDPNHLILGDRYANYYSQAVARAAGKYLDVVSVNYDAFEQSGWMSPVFFDTLYRLTGRPIVVTEFYVAAMENRSGNLNRQGPFLVVQTQKERAEVAGAMAEQMARLPYVVGYHWFRWSDEPTTGRRKDGEDFNMGLVDLNDRPYEGLTAMFARVNRTASSFHQPGPTRAGLASVGGVWDVPAASPSTTADWGNAKLFGPAYLVPTVTATAPWLPFADFYVAWQPDGLLFGAAYQDSFGGGGGSTALANRQRLVLTVAEEKSRPQQVLLVGLGESEAVPGGANEEGRLKRLVPYAGGEFTLSPQLLGVEGRQRADGGIDQALQVFIPAASLGLKQLTQGSRLRLGASLIMRGDAKETFWPSSQVGTQPTNPRTATLRLTGSPLQ